MIRQLFTQSPVILESLVYIFRKRIMMRDTFRDLAIEFGQFAMLGPQQILEIQGSVVRKFVATYKCIGREIWMINPDSLHQTGPHRFQ